MSSPTPPPPPPNLDLDLDLVARLGWFCTPHRIPYQSGQWQGVLTPMENHQNTLNQIIFNLVKRTTKNTPNSGYS